MINHELFKYLQGFLTTERKARFLEVLTNRTNYLTVALEDVFQLHNTSAVVRSCDAFGIQSLHVVEERFGQRLDKNIAMGAQQWVDVKRYNTNLDCLQELKEQGYQIVATSPHDQSITLDNFEFKGKTALFFGTEWNGLSKEIMDASDSRLHISMVGFSESLNISVSVALTLQHLANKLRNSELPWQLSQEEQLDIQMNWTKKSIKDVDNIIKRYLTN